MMLKIICKNELHKGVSAGVKEVIGVFLRYTEGAYAVNYGNSSIGYLLTSRNVR